MKKPKFNTFKIIAVFFCVIFFNSCQDSSNEDLNPSLKTSLSKMEYQILNEYIVIEDSKTPFDNLNESFFRNFKMIMDLKGGEKLESSSEKILSTYNKEMSHLLRKETQETNLTIEEELIFKSLFKIFTQTDINKLLILDYYISEIKKNKFSGTSTLSCLSRLSFLKSLFVFINYYDNGVGLSNKSLYTTACWEACMSDKADSVWKYGNWVDKAVFLATAAETVGGWIVSCAWDCRNA